MLKIFFHAIFCRNWIPTVGFNYDDNDKRVVESVYVEALICSIVGDWEHPPHKEDLLIVEEVAVEVVTLSLASSSWGQMKHWFWFVDEAAKQKLRKMVLSFLLQLQVKIAMAEMVVMDTAVVE